MLLLGGTTEGRELAERLSGVAGLHVVSSLAGRLDASADPAGEVRRGGFGGPEGMATWLRDHASVVVDATHPFAAQVSAHAATAAASAGVPLLRLQRPGWQAGEGDRWLRVPDLAAAAAALPLLGRTALLTTGQQGLVTFAEHPACRRTRLIARCAQEPVPLPPHVEVVVARGPFDLADELDLLRREAVEVVVTKDSGGDATRAKLDAASLLDLPVVVVDRPPPVPGVPVVSTVADAEAWVLAVTSGAGR